MVLTEDEQTMSTLMILQTLSHFIGERRVRMQSRRKKALTVAAWLVVIASGDGWFPTTRQQHHMCRLLEAMCLEKLEEAVLCCIVKRKSRPRDDTIRVGSDTGFLNMLHEWHPDMFRRVFRVTKAMYTMMCNDLRHLVPDNQAPESLAQFSNVNRTTEFKVGCFLYYTGHSVDFEVLGHVTGCGRETVRRYVYRVARALCKVYKDRWMPTTAPTPHQLEETYRAFSARRGIWGCAVTVDGTHVPWWPSDASTRNYFRNYKGWYSLNCLAWVSPFYTFVDAEIGYAARVGDSVMLQYSSMKRRIMANLRAWLGPRGFAIGDGRFGSLPWLLTPYTNPRIKRHKYFNFCVSSTRFFIEQAFGMWKNRFRQLRDYQYNSAESMSWIILSTMILHNMCMGLGDCTVDDIADAANDPLAAGWMSKKLLQAFTRPPVGLQPGLCVRCELKGREQCRHGLRQVVSHSDIMSRRRSEISHECWRLFLEDHPDKAGQGEDEADVDPGEFSDLEE